MRFEKINENKLKIELTKEDLIEHNIKLTDIAYGSENSRKLLHEILEQAFNELEFEHEDVPLVIEAVPTSSFSINVFITKIKDEKEFEKSMDLVNKQNEKRQKNLKNLEKLGSDFEKMVEESLGNKNESKKPNKPQSILEKTEMVYKFGELDDTIHLSQVLNKIYDGKSTLYKYENAYYLILNAKNYTKDDIVKLRLTLDEFGEFVSTHKVAQGYLKEYGTIIVKKDVFKNLAKIV